MPGPLPKDPATLQRPSKARQRGLTVLGPSDVAMPVLPSTHVWHPQTLAWWTDLWSSPMASELVKADVHELFVLAVLVDAFWTNPSKELAAEIRLQRQCFGLTPLDRRRLQWEIERGESAVAATKERKKPAAVRKGKDPRSLLAG